MITELVELVTVSWKRCHWHCSKLPCRGRLLNFPLYSAMAYIYHTSQGHLWWLSWTDAYSFVRHVNPIRWLIINWIGQTDDQIGKQWFLLLVVDLGHSGTCREAYYQCKRSQVTTGHRCLSEPDSSIRGHLGVTKEAPRGWGHDAPSCSPPMHLSPGSTVWVVLSCSHEVHVMILINVFDVDVEAFC